MHPQRNSEPDSYSVSVTFRHVNEHGALHQFGTGGGFDSNAFMDWPEERAAVDKFLRSARRTLMHTIKCRRKARAQ